MWSLRAIATVSSVKVNDSLYRHRLFAGSYAAMLPVRYSAFDGAKIAVTSMLMQLGLFVCFAQAYVTSVPAKGEGCAKVTRRAYSLRGRGVKDALNRMHQKADQACKSIPM